MSRIELAGALWPDSKQRQAGANLRTALWRIGQAVGKGWAETADGGLSLPPLQVRVDLREISPVCQRLATGGSPGAAPEAAFDEGTVAQLCKRLLPGWHDDWLLLEQERWDQLRLHALEAASRLLTARGNHALAIEAALVAARSEPLRESAHRAVVSAYLAEGNLGAALKHYHGFKALLLRELGVTPTSSMDDLIRPLVYPSGAEP
ncbi:MAG TPA: BTAD domain-containing putative transcriptional regulator, partial [Kineosporiaceae bacterium]